jgi:nucleoside-diphosphate-sugar epimerase
MRCFGRGKGRRVSLVRAPGIYAADRLPIDRLRRGTPAIVAAEDSYTNHIHADDLARIVWAALWRGKPNRVYNAVDDSALKMGDYFDLVADAFGLPRPQRISRQQAGEQLPAGLLSFMSESRRLRNRRLKEELRVDLRYLQVSDGIRAASRPHDNQQQQEK